MATTIHNPDQYMADFRQILAQGRKRLGLLLGAGAPASILVTPDKKNIIADGQPLIPTVKILTAEVMASLENNQREILKKICVDLGADPNIEKILSRIRALAGALAANKMEGLDGTAFGALSSVICENIGKIVNVTLPHQANAFSELAVWIGGTAREHAFEIFTPNYDLIMEEAFERARIPYFDGFSGSREPFFDAASIAADDAPSRWARLWKLHGSIGWDTNPAGEIIRGRGATATKLIYPTHEKYDEAQKLPYSALIERFRRFLQTPDTLLMTIGFSFSDAHLTAVIDEALAANKATSVIALQFNEIEFEPAACDMALRRANMSVYARDGAVINGIRAPWRLGDPPHQAWIAIRDTFWNHADNGSARGFLLGDFVAFARYVARTRADQILTLEDLVPTAKKNA